VSTTRQRCPRSEILSLPRIAAIYVRVSTVQQARDEKTSLETQEAGCRRWAVIISVLWERNNLSP
jgi:hypothetical protein